MATLDSHPLNPTDILSRILATKVDEVAAARQLRSGAEVLAAARAAGPIRDFEVALRAIRHEAARRAIVGAPGPWGADAPAPPPARFDEERS